LVCRTCIFFEEARQLEVYSLEVRHPMNLWPESILNVDRKKSQDISFATHLVYDGNSNDIRFKIRVRGSTGNSNRVVLLSEEISVERLISEKSLVVPFYLYDETYFYFYRERHHCANESDKWKN